ncbi:MAG: hypothetical protein M3224_00410 [Thermoproteota archaeon]|nr:hypothetical protein [Thermoproteota archaeon]
MLECEPIDKSCSNLFHGIQKISWYIYWLFMAIEVKARGWEISRLEAATAITSFVIGA